MTTRDDVVMAAKNVMRSGTGSVFLFRALDTKAVASTIVALSDEQSRPQETPRRAPDAGAGGDKPDEPRATKHPRPVFRHYKGLDYIITGYARHTETQEMMVVYRSTLSREGDTEWVRPAEMFFDNNTPDGRLRFALLQAAPSGRTPTGPELWRGIKLGIQRGTKISCGSCGILIGMFCLDVPAEQPALPDQVLFHDLGARGGDTPGPCSACGEAWFLNLTLTPPNPGPAKAPSP